MKITVNVDKRMTRSYEETDSDGLPLRFGDWETYYDSRVTGVFAREPTAWNDVGTEVPDRTKEVYVVYVIYSTGSTFGRSYGEISVPAVFLTEDEARNCVSRISNNEFKSEESITRYGLEWNGWFESLEIVDYQKFEIIYSK